MPGGWFDDRLGDGFAVVTRVALPEIAAHVVPVAPGSPLWTGYPGAAALVVRPNRTVLGAVHDVADLVPLLRGVAATAGEP